MEATCRYHLPNYTASHPTNFLISILTAVELQTFTNCKEVYTTELTIIMNYNLGQLVTLIIMFIHVHQLYNADNCNVKKLVS